MTDTAYPPALHELVQAQVARTPAAIAVIDETSGAALRYEDLDARANRLARHLVACGVGTDARVALYLDRSLEMVVAMLAASKAGGAYLPLDTEAPADRIAFMLDDAKARVVLTTRTRATELPAADVIALDELEPTLPVSGSLERRTHAEASAYVLYTSGSTGTPKAVVIPHRAIVAHMAWMQAEFPLGPDAVVLQKTAYGFDASVWEFWAPLLAGGRLVMARPSAHRDPAYLVEAIPRLGVTTLQVVPTMLRALLDQPGIERCTSLQRVFCGGEALSGELIARATQRLSATIINLYGPTETTIDATFFVAPRTADPPPIVPIGAPITGAAVHVVDEHLVEVPRGAAGELLLGGATVGRGYLGRPALTAAAFVPDPFGPPGARAYRSGDLGRVGADGLVEYQGRVDHQVKIRGNRVELGEIEAALASYVRVRQVAATVHALAGEPTLVGYYTGELCTTQELRAHLRRTLPEHMVPSAFVHLERLPLLANGKLDRRALPAPAVSTDERVVEPRTATEALVLRIWEAALKTSAIGIDRDFFELGGTSLTAVGVLTQLRKQLGVTLPLTAMIKSNTVEKLAALATEKRPASAWSPLVEIQPKGEGAPLFCVHPVFGETLCYFALAKKLGASRPVLGLQAVGVGDGRPALNDVGQMAELYLAAVRKVQPVGPYRLAGWSFGGIVAFEMARRLIAGGERVELLANFDQPLPDPAYKQRATKPRAQLEDPEFILDQILFFFTANGRRLSTEAVAALKQLPPEQMFRTAFDIGIRDKLLPEGFGFEQLRGFIGIYKSHQQAMTAYEAQPYPDKLVLFRCAHRETQTLGWERVCREVEVVQTPGEHFALFSREDSLTAMATEIERRLSRPA